MKIKKDIIRIKYLPVEYIPGLYRATQYFVGSCYTYVDNEGKIIEVEPIYSVEYNLNTMSWKIKNIMSGRVHRNKTTPQTEVVLRRQIRKKLVKLGVKFKEDVNNIQYDRVKRGLL